jgi:hypothetical protein
MGVQEGKIGGGGLCPRCQKCFFKNILDDIFGVFYTFKRHTFMLRHTSDVHKHNYFSLEAGISVLYEKTYN